MRELNTSESIPVGHLTLDPLDTALQGADCLSMRHTIWCLALLVVGCESSPTAPSDGGSAPSNFESDVAALVSQARLANQPCANAVGSTLREHGALTRAAQDHSRDMADRQVMSHTGSDGSNFQQRAQRAGYPGVPLGENIARGQPTPAVVVSSWLNSPGHCLNIMNPSATEIGVGLARGYWTMVTGRGR